MSQNTTTGTSLQTTPMSPRTCPICLEDLLPANDDPLDPANVTLNSQDGNDSVKEHSPLQDTTTATAFTLPACQHEFCQPCLVTHVQHAVQTKRMPLACPEIACRAEVTKDTLQDLLPQMQDLVAEVERLTILQAHAQTLVPCTACAALVPVPSSTTSNTADGNQKDNKDSTVTPDTSVPCPDLVCPACRHAFCRVHGDMHPGVTCAAFYQTPQGLAVRQTEQALRRFTKPCSRCGAQLQKYTGCDYVVCGHCQGDMCYRCGTHEHLQGTSFRRCTACKSTYHNQGRLPMALGCLCLLLLAIFTIALVVAWPAVAAVFVLASGCCGCCFHCGRRLDASSRSRQQQQQNDNQPYQPLRGILAVVVILFLPLAMLMDGAYMVWSGNEDGFLDRVLPELSGKAEEIPTMELVEPTTPRTVVSVDNGDDGGADDFAALESEIDLEKGQDEGPAHLLLSETKKSYGSDS